MTKFIQFGAIGIILFIASSFTTASKGYKYSSNEGKYSISFPGTFEESKSQNENSISVKVSATVGQSTYFTSHTVHTVEMTDNQMLAEVSLDSFTESLGGSITKKSDWVIKKHKGLKASIDIPQYDAKAEYQIVIIGQIQYQIVAVAPTSSWDQKSADAFFKSFKVKK